MAFSITINKTWHSAWWMSVVMLSIICAECHWCLVSFMLSVTNKPLMLSVVMLNVVILSVTMPSVVAPFRPSLVFPSRARAYPSGAPFWRTHQRKAPILSNKYKARLWRLDGYKHSSLFCVFFGDENKRFVNIDTRGLYHKTYYGRNLRFP